MTLDLCLPCVFAWDGSRYDHIKAKSSSKPSFTSQDRPTSWEECWTTRSSATGELSKFFYCSLRLAAYSSSLLATKVVASRLFSKAWQVYRFLAIWSFVHGMPRKSHPAVILNLEWISRSSQAPMLLVNIRGWSPVIVPKFDQEKIFVLVSQKF